MKRYKFLFERRGKESPDCMSGRIIDAETSQEAWAQFEAKYPFKFYTVFRVEVSNIPGR